MSAVVLLLQQVLRERAQRSANERKRKREEAVAKRQKVKR